MTTSSRLGLLFFALELGACASPAGAGEERAMTSSNLEEGEEDGAERQAPASLTVGTTLTLRLSTNIRADLLPKARLADIGPFQSVTYGRVPNMLVIADGRVGDRRGEWTCEVRGSRPRPGVNERFFPPILPNPLPLVVTAAPEGTSGVTAFLRSAEPDENDTSWSVDCVKADPRESRTATLAELESAFDSGSQVTLD